MNKRQEAFIEAYLDSGKETYGHGRKSAEKAGYSPANAAWQSTYLLKDPKISKLMEEKCKKQATRYQKSKDEAIVEARKNYDEAETPSMKKFWWEQWTNLQGWQVQKSESTSKTEIVAKEEQSIADLVRRQMQEVN